MERVAYFLALLTVTTIPPAILMWFLIHPFADRWRKLGPKWTYALVGGFCTLCVVALVLVREPLLHTRYGVRLPLLLAALPIYLFAAYLEILRRRHLKTYILVGLPEVSSERYPGKLLDEGIYARIRHPRYVSFFFGILAVALFTNYLATWLLAVATLPAIYALVVIEERELRQRFGEAYVEYSQRVPRFIPRWETTTAE